MLSTTRSLFLSFLLISAHLALAAPSLPREDKPDADLPTSIHLHSYTNPSTSSDCNLDCRRIFCSSVSQFLESVTCTSHRPCLSLNLQFKIQEKCLNWRPEIHHASGAAAIGGVATPVASQTDAAAASTKDAAGDPDCAESALPPSAPQWVKAYVPADIGYEWLRKGEASKTRPMPVLKDEAKGKVEVVCIGAIKWLCFVSVAVALFCAWQIVERRQRRQILDRRVKGKEEL